MEINETTINIMVMEPTALDAYLNPIQHKRMLRKKIAYWQDSLERLRRELEIARSDGNTRLVDEIETIIDGFQSTLGGVGRHLHMNADLPQLDHASGSRSSG